MLEFVAIEIRWSSSNQNTTNHHPPKVASQERKATMTTMMHDSETNEMVSTVIRAAFILISMGGDDEVARKDFRTNQDHSYPVIQNHSHLEQQHHQQQERRDSIKRKASAEHGGCEATDTPSTPKKKSGRNGLAIDDSFLMTLH
jgi:hypothetical protein